MVRKRAHKIVLTYSEVTVHNQALTDREILWNSIGKILWNSTWKYCGTLRGGKYCGTLWGGEYYGTLQGGNTVELLSTRKCKV